MSLVRVFLQRVKDASREAHDRAQSGQAIVIIALVALALIAIMGLAIDGGRLLFLRRDAQNAADAAAIAAGRALCQNNPNYLNIGLAAAETNGFDDRGLTSDRNGNEVEINAPPLNASVPISPECAGCYLEAMVTAEIPPSFIGIVYGGPLQVTSKAISACNQHLTGEDEVGLRAMFGLSDTCEVDITGSDFIVEGGMHSNNDLKYGSAGTVSGPATYADSLQLPSGQSKKITFQPGSGSSNFDTLTGRCERSCFSSAPTNGGGGSGGSGETCDMPQSDAPYKTCDTQPDPLAYHIEDFRPGGQYAVAASAGGEYYSFIHSQCRSQDVEGWLNTLISGESLPDGLYYTNCSVDLNQNLLNGKITLVTEDTVHLSGRNQNLKPYMLDLLIFANGGSDRCSEKAVQFSGSSNKWWGNIYAPHGQAKFSGSLNSSTLMGCVVAYDVDFSGSNNVLLCNATSPDTTPGLFLPE